MAVSDGQRVNAQVTNAAYLSRTQDSDTVGKIDLNNADTAAITDVQGTINNQQSQITDNDTDIATLFSTKQDIAEKGVANGYPELDATGRIPVNQLPTVALTFLGNWDANTNTPTLADGVGTNGDQYRTSVAGTQDLGSGSIDFAVGDTVTYNGTIWEKQDFSGGTDALTTKGDILTRDASTEVRVPVGTDGQVLVAASAEASGLRWENQSGGVGGINYVQNSDAETDANNHTIYDDGAVDTPVDGDGGSPTTTTVTRTTVSTEILRGDASFKLEKTAADGQGEGVHIGLDPIDPRDKDKRLQVSFDYKMPTGTSIVDGDYRVFVYDVDNAALIGAIENDDNGDILLHTGDGATFIGWFNATDSLNYRLLIHTTDTDATAREFYYDNIKLGPEEFTNVVSQKTATLDATGSGGFTGGEVQVKRTGDVVSIIGTSDLTFASSSSVTSAVAFLPDWATPDVAVSNVFARNSTEIVRAQVNADGSINVDFRNYSGASVSLTSTGSFNISYNVSGETNVVSNTELSQSVVFADGDHTTGQAIANNAFVTVIFDTEFEDDCGVYDNTTGVFTAKRDGLFLFNFAVAFSANSNGVRGTATLINGTDRKICNSVPATTAPSIHTSSGTRLVRLSKGDTVEMEAVQTSGVSINLSTAANNSFFSINSLPDFSTYGVLNPNTEIVEADSSTIVNYPIASDIWGDLTSIDLPRGTWDLNCVATWYSNGVTTTTSILIGIGTTSGNSDPGQPGLRKVIDQKSTASDEYDSQAFYLSNQVVTNSSQTYYLKGFAENSVSNLQIAYKITARRVK